MELQRTNSAVLEDPNDAPISNGAPLRAAELATGEGASRKASAAPLHLLDPDGPTSAVYGAIEHAYDFFNQTLFGGILPGALITLRADRRSLSFFNHQRFASEGGKFVDEIALNSAYFGIWPVECTLSALAHEMCHQAMHYRHNVNPSSTKPGYHSKEWADQMIGIGLFPSATGRPGGKTTGEGISHYIIVGGNFQKACSALKQTDFALHWYDRYPSSEAVTNKAIISAAPSQEDEQPDIAEHESSPALSLAREPEPPRLPDSLANQLQDINRNIEGRKKAAIVGDRAHAIREAAPAARPFPIKTGHEVSEIRKGFGVDSETPSFVIEEQVIELPTLLVKPDTAGRKQKSKVTYQCPACESKVWGKPNLRILCGCIDPAPVFQATGAEPTASDLS